MKRVRANGGCRTGLQPEGIVIFGHAHRAYTKELQLPDPGPSEFIAVRIAESTSEKGVKIGGSWWRVAVGGDPVRPAPVL